MGANTVIFSVVEGVLLKPLPYPQPEQLIGVWHTAPGIGLKELNMAPSIYFIDREQNTTLQDIGAYSGDSLNVTGAGQPEHVRGLDVTDGTLPILGVAPALGRLFTRKDDSPGAPQTVLLSYGYWQKKFGGASSVIGRSITVDGKPREIIGVLPRGFHFLDQQDAALILPFQWDRSKTKLGNFSEQAIARLKPGVTMAQASADMARLLPIVLRSFPAPEGFSASLFEKARISPNLRPLKQDVVGDVGKVLWVLMGSIVLVLLVACANVANLLLVRVEGRRQELAIRSALGAGWGRIAAELLFESVVLGVAGSLIGLALAYGALRLLVAMAPTGLPRIHEIGIDLPVLLFTLALALFTSLLIGFIPVIKYAGASVNSGLREGGRALSQSRERHRARKALVIVQVALALVLLICSGLMIRTFRALMHVSPGFAEPDSVQTFRFYIPETQIPDTQRERVVRMDQEILDKLAAIPGVSSVSFSNSVPMDGYDTNDVLYAQDHVYRRGRASAHTPLQIHFPRILRDPGHAAGGRPRSRLGRTSTRSGRSPSSRKISRASIGMNRERRAGQEDSRRQHRRLARDRRSCPGRVTTMAWTRPRPPRSYWPVMHGPFRGAKGDAAARNRVCHSQSARRLAGLHERGPARRSGRSIPMCPWPMSPHLASCTPNPWRGLPSRW